MGRLPSAPVDWAEINAAWGQVTILLAALARKVNLNFQRYKLVPFGSQSYIVDSIDGKILPLYGSGGFRFLWDAKFDAGMVAFLDCLQQFQLKVEGTTNVDSNAGRLNFQFPYRSVKFKIYIGIHNSSAFWLFSEWRRVELKTGLRGNGTLSKFNSTQKSNGPRL